MTSRAKARRVVLGITAVVFTVIAGASLVAPHFMAEPLGFRLDNANALNEFRAIYVGLWLAHAFVLAWAARRIDVPELGDVAGILILGQVVGRLISVGLDGLPDQRLWPISVVELLGAVVILVLRPARSDQPET